MSGFTKLFSSIVTSSIWCEDDKTRLVWVTMLALADKNGVVEASIPGLSNAARVPLDDTRRAIVTLMSPDPDSRTRDYGGRRIKECDGGWLLLNHAKYRQKLSKEDRADYQRVKQAEYRSRKKDGLDGKPASAAYKAREAAAVKAYIAGDESALDR